MATKYITRGICLIIPALIFLIYFTTSNQIADGKTIMPLDDVYIHFQYARSFAEGTPYVYNMGEPPTSGATSFIYPILLSVGYLIGFKGLALGIYAMLIGALALAISMRLLIHLAQQFNIPLWGSYALAVGFALSGVISWHFQSGMETGLMIALSLATLTALWHDNARLIAFSTALLALTRPEGSIMALIVVGIYGIKQFINLATRRQLIWLLIPLSAFFIQPIINGLITGSFSASGGQAKSILNTFPFFLDDVTARIIENFLRMWSEFMTDTAYTLILLVPTALMGFITLIRRRFYIGLIVLVWLIAVSGAIATLDTAFWHFKRYQMPLIALFYPLSAYGLVALANTLQRRKPFLKYLPLVLVGVMLVSAITNGFEFLRLYRVNVQNVIDQPYPMAEWLKANTPLDARVAVHDVGMMRYMGERHTVDMVGLTTSESAPYWQNGPGSVGEFLLKTRPEYVAAYTDARGLGYLVDTPLYNYGEALAGFTAVYAHADNVAVGAEYQGIYAIDWSSIDAYPADQPYQPSIIDHINSAPIGQVNVSDLVSEDLVDYQIDYAHPLEGYATEFYTFPYLDCLDACLITDGGRIINGQETFTFNLPPEYIGQDLLLVSRVHALESESILITANQIPVANRQIIQQAGRWLEIGTIIPAQDSDYLTITIQPETTYSPYYHWLYGLKPPESTSQTPIATFQDQAIDLLSVDLSVVQENLLIDLAWQKGIIQPSGDYKLFVHVYDDVQKPPVAQLDTYTANNTMPPANWLNGVIFDQIMVDLNKLNEGRYQVAIGFYHATNFSRLSPQSQALLIDHDRLFIGEITLPSGDGG
jgi:hypothetical protein